MHPRWLLGHGPARLTQLTSSMSFAGPAVPRACRPSTGLCADERRSVSDAAFWHRTSGAFPTGFSGEEAVMQCAPDSLPDQPPNGRLTAGID
jgi:hypothetical protein